MGKWAQVHHTLSFHSYLSLRGYCCLVQSQGEIKIRSNAKKMQAVFISSWLCFLLSTDRYSIYHFHIWNSVTPLSPLKVHLWSHWIFGSPFPVIPTMSVECTCILYYFFFFSFITRSQLLPSNSVFNSCFESLTQTRDYSVKDHLKLSPAIFNDAV